MKHFTTLILIVLVAFAALGYLASSMQLIQQDNERLQQQVHELLTTVDALRTENRVVRTENQKLERKLQTTEAELHAWQEWTLTAYQAQNASEAERALLQDHRNALPSDASLDLSRNPVQAGFLSWPDGEETGGIWVASVAFLAVAIAGLWRWSTHRRMRPKLDFGQDVVQVTLPRNEVTAFVQWRRQRQAGR